MMFDLYSKEREQATTDTETGLKILVVKKDSKYGIGYNLMIFTSKAKNPYVDKFYLRESEMKEAIKFYKDRIIDIKQENKKRREERKATSDKLTSVKVGDVFYTSWGYDQTNIDFYQITAISKSKVTVREINAKTVKTEGAYSSEIIAVKDSFASKSEEFTKLIQFSNNQPYFTVKERIATPWYGDPIYTSWGY